MGRILKVFVKDEEQKAVAREQRPLARYESFVIVDVPPKAAAALRRKYLIEDITDQYEIPLRTRTINTRKPRVDEKGRVRPHPGYRGLKAPPTGRHHYLVQFVGPIKTAWLAGVRRVGGEPREPQGGFTYIVRADRKAVGAISALPYVRWVGHLPHPDRIEPAVMAAASGARRTRKLPRTRTIPGALVVEFFGPRDVTKAVGPVRKLGFKILTKDPSAKLLILCAKGDRLTRRQIQALSAVHAVRSVRERTLDRPSNDVAAQFMGVTRAMKSTALGLGGHGQVVAICDTGLDTGDPDTIHPDFAKRVIGIKSYPITPDMDPYIDNPRDDDGPADLDSGHGTHVAGSVLGSGDASRGLNGVTKPIRGLAYRAKLYFQAVEQRTNWKKAKDYEENGPYGLVGIPSNLGTLFADAYKAGARIHSNSWGGGEPGEYDDQCRQLDEFVWMRKDFCVLAANGNDGTDHDRDGRIDEQSVSSPATAKNCISVGACESRRPQFNKETYGEWWPKDYPKAPIKNDAMANDPEQVVAFSSRGPTRDGRVKPEVVAPGTFILSTRSRLIAQSATGWSPFPGSKLYFYDGGTSMATPLTAGAVALIREYLGKKRGLKQPTAALLKAILIAGARRLRHADTNGGLFDNHQGFGRVDLDRALAPASPAKMRFVEVTPGLKTGETHTVTITVKSAAAPLRIVLVYSDYPGPRLVNNLNLIVTAPSGRQYAGNQTGVTGASLDTVNNTEVLEVAKPASGNWTVDIVGSNIAKGPQDFALVYLGHV